MEEKAQLMDLAKCSACRGCQVACKQWNQLAGVVTKNTGTYENPPAFTPQTYLRVQFREVVIDGKVKWLFMKDQCMHCTKAPCVEMCPVASRTKDEFGFTEIDRNKCIGCGICVAVCPYQVPTLDSVPKTQSCWFCLDRVVAGMKPACAKACPAGAIRYGSREDMLKLGHEAVAKSGGKVTLYGEKEMGGLHMMYLLPEKPEYYGLSSEGRLNAEKLSKLEVYAMLEKKLQGSPVRTEVLTMAALKYFGQVKI